MKLLMMVLIVGLLGCTVDKDGAYQFKVNVVDDVDDVDGIGEGYDDGVFTIFNRGKAGNTTTNILKSIGDVILDYPDLAVIMAGTNDALNSRKQVDIVEYEKNLNAIVNLMLSIDSSVILMTIPPAISEYILERHSEEAFEYFGGVSEIIDAYNLVIRRVAATNNVYLYDLNSLVVNASGDLYEFGSLLRNDSNRGIRDGVHLTIEGYYSVAMGLCNMININGGKVVTIGDSITVGVHEIGSYPSYLVEMLNSNCDI